MSQPTQTASWAALQVWPEVRAHCSQHRATEQGQPRRMRKRNPQGWEVAQLMATEKGNVGTENTVHPRSD